MSSVPPMAKENHLANLPIGSYKSTSHLGCWENGRSSNHKRHFYKRKLSQKFSKKSPSVRLSKHSNIGQNHPPTTRSPKQKHQGTQVSGLRICIIQLQDHRISLLLFNGLTYRQRFWEITRAIPKEVVLRGMKWMFPKNSGVFHPNHPFWQGVSMKFSPSILGYHYFWKHPNNDQKSIGIWKGGDEWKIYDSKKSPTGPAERTPTPE